MPCSDPLEPVLRQLEAERYGGGWWRRRMDEHHLSNAPATPEQIAELNAEIAESDRTDRKAAEARRAAARAARVEAWKRQREKAG